MRNPLQEQLLKAGLVNKTRAAQVVREQAGKRKGKAPAKASPEQIQAQRLQAEKAEHDRALAAASNAQRRTHEARAQARQIVETHKLTHDGEIAYRLADGDRIREILVSEAQRAQLAAGVLVIARHDEACELLPRAAADKVAERDPAMIVLDHAREKAGTAHDADDEYYQQFEVPDDLIW
ncbi:MAG: DUF2058 domain-containing protein [Rhodanobacter sp.]